MKIEPEGNDLKLDINFVKAGEKRLMAKYTELEILKEMLTGDSNQEIAERLFVSPGTIKRHVENLLLKTGFHTRTELVAEAVRLGIVFSDKK